jgi:hypothetical protein
MRNEELLAVAPTNRGGDQLKQEEVEDSLIEASRVGNAPVNDTQEDTDDRVYDESADQKVAFLKGYRVNNES